MPRLGRVGRGYHLAMPLLKDADMPLGVCEVRPDDHFPSSSQQYSKGPKEALAPPCGCSGCGFPSTPTCFPLHRQGSQGLGGRGNGKTSLTLSWVLSDLWPYPLAFETLKSCTEMPVPAPLGCSLPPGGSNKPCLATSGMGTTPGLT